MQPQIYQANDHDIDPLKIDRDALFVIHRLKEAGFAAYLVGGSVRDLLLKRAPKDIDISTSAKPEEIKRLFGRQCLLIGRRFRLAHLRFGHKILEVSTFRAGEASENLITQDNVWGTEQEDVLRRDFTINGLFYDPENHVVIDYVGGWKDIHDHCLRSIGDPEIRFKQDPVRMIRLIKFEARFGFKVDEQAYLALYKCREEISKSSPARILEEIFRMLESCTSKTFLQLLLKHGFLHLLFPNLAASFESSKGQQMLDFLSAVDEINKHSTKYPIERSVLVSALIYPILEQEVEERFLSKDKTPHIGDIIMTTTSIIKEKIITSFSHFPKRISALMLYVLTTQYRLTPLKNKRHHPIKLFRTREFPLALRLFKIRATIYKELQPAYISWRENYRHFLRSQEHQYYHHHRAKDQSLTH